MATAFLRLDDGLHCKLRMLCAYKNISINQHVSALIKNDIDTFEREFGALPTPSKKNAAARDDEKKEPP